MDERIREKYFNLLGSFCTTSDDTNTYWITMVNQSMAPLGEDDVSMTFALAQTLKNVPPFHFYSGEYVAPPKDSFL